jgi:cytochrome oxidase Cu insertion factor (SCO1/SenC/PrrC family)
MSDTDPGHAPPGRARWAAPGGQPGAAPGRGRRLVVVLAALTVVLAAMAISSAVLVIRHNQATVPGQLLRPSGIPPDIPTSLANLMSLTPVPAVRAPGFTLTDQHGRTVALSGLRGKAVVLTFMDSHCVNICPIVSEELIDAYHRLGPLAGKVVFAAVIVNPHHASVSDVALLSRDHQLTTIPGWHFLTGPAGRLRAVWRAYNIEVQARGPNTDTVHTSAVYFIDPQGREKYLASPMADYTKAGSAYLPAGQIASWGRGIALVSRTLAR